MNLLPIVETFHSLQGEGYWTGCSAFFIRLAGCDVGCPWCDTKQSWSQKLHPWLSIEALVQEAVQAQPQFVVITGGEPLMHNLEALTQALHDRGLPIHLETSGAYPLTGKFDWMTLSPKPFKPPDPAIYPHVQELKVVISSPADLQWAESQSRLVSPAIPKYLQPEWQKLQSLSGSYLVQYIKDHPQWRLSLQTHKFLQIR
jgi:7-carboxy-7-deazaguanine synthase